MIYDKGSFTVVPNIQKLTGQKPHVQTVFMWLCVHANQEGECFPSRKLIAKEAGTSVKSVDRAMLQLEKLGVLVRWYRFNYGEQTTNKYNILLSDKGGDCVTLGGDCVTHRTISSKLKVKDSNSELLRNSSSLSKSEKIAENAEPQNPANAPQSIGSLPVGNAVHTIPPSSAAPPFQEFWALYPRKISKSQAQKAWNKIKNPQEVMDGLRRYKTYWAKNKTEDRFIPHPSTWLNQARWEDDLNATGFKFNPL